MNSLYYVVFGIIVVLAGLNLASLLWVVSLQKRLKDAAVKPAVAAPTSTTEAHAVMLAEELLRLETTVNGDVQKAFTQMTQGFQSDLATTSKKINTQVAEMAEKVVQEELTRYQATFEELRKSAMETLTKVQEAIEAQNREKADAITGQVDVEKKKIIEKFEQKLGDIVAGYLVEALGANVDLGAQRGYLFETLEAHKDELKKAIVDGP